jgi:hypothetical protein
MPDGVIDLLGFAGSVVFAIPVAFFGLLRITEGDMLVGGGFLALAAVMVVGMELYTSPTDVAGGIAKRVAGKVVKQPDDEE